MYRGFDLTIDWSKVTWNTQEYIDIGRRVNSTNASGVKSDLSKYISPNGNLDGKKMVEEWFPDVKADIFISYSHKDQNSALALAGWLSKHLEITAFIDHNIWGYSDDLLRDIDNNYCLNPSRDTYDYEKRNDSTSHVHMMLNTAIMKMIDRTECIFLLNTPNAISAANAINNSTTHSPWIYSEMVISQLIRKNEVSTYRKELLKSMNENVRMFAENKLRIEHPIPTGHLSKLNDVDLMSWEQLYKPHRAAIPKNVHPLDSLYSLKKTI